MSNISHPHHPPISTLPYAERSYPQPLIQLFVIVRCSQRYHTRNNLIHNLSYNCSSSSAVLNVTIRGTVLSTASHSTVRRRPPFSTLPYAERSYPNLSFNCRLCPPFSTIPYAEWSYVQHPIQMLSSSAVVNITIRGTVLSTTSHPIAVTIRRSQSYNTRNCLAHYISSSHPHQRLIEISIFVGKCSAHHNVNVGGLLLSTS